MDRSLAGGTACPTENISSVALSIIFSANVETPVAGGTACATDDMQCCHVDFSQQMLIGLPLAPDNVRTTRESAGV
jgi:hypothetical protein